MISTLYSFGESHLGVQYRCYVQSENDVQNGLCILEGKGEIDWQLVNGSLGITIPRSFLAQGFYCTNMTKNYN